MKRKRRSVLLALSICAACIFAFLERLMQAETPAYLTGFLFDFVTYRSEKSTFFKMGYTIGVFHPECFAALSLADAGLSNF